MFGAIRHWPIFALGAALAHGASAAAARRWTAPPPPAGASLSYEQSSGRGEGDERGTYQRIRRNTDPLSAEYGFRNFNDDSLSVAFSLKKPAFESYQASFGYHDKDIEELRSSHERARQGAYQLAVKTRKSQAQLDAAIAALKAEYDRKLRDYMASKGFKILPGNLVAVDMPRLVGANAPLLKSVAMALDQIRAQRSYDSENLVGAATSLVQTAVRYQIPPPLDASKHTGGVLPPVTSLLWGWGDCDTKTGLLASILANWPHMRMVGIAVPKHYLLALLRIPGKGDLFVEHEGLQYVLIEPAGPAWLAPGSVSPDTEALLAGSEGYQIEPFF